MHLYCVQVKHQCVCTVFHQCTDEDTHSAMNCMFSRSTPVEETLINI